MMPDSPLLENHFLLDIETSGLLKNNHSIISIGIIYQESSKIKSVQWFAKSTMVEKELLIAFLQFCQPFSKVYTYNGNRFDIPFILSRLTYHGLNTDDFTRLLCIDLKKVISKLDDKRMIAEQILGYTRVSTLTGKEIARLYPLLSKNNTTTHQSVILNHQLDELKSLLCFYEYYTLINHLADYQLLDLDSSDNMVLCVKLQTLHPFKNACVIKVQNIELVWSAQTPYLLLRIPIYQGVFKKYLRPAKDYYWITDQQQLMHKSIAQFIPKAFKQKVHPKDCFIKQSGAFIKLYTSFNKPIDQWYSDDEELFVKYENPSYLIPLLLEQISFLLTTSS